MKTKIFIFTFFALLLTAFIFGCRKTAPDASGNPTATATATGTQAATLTATRTQAAYTATMTPTATIVIVLNQHFDSDVEGWTLDAAHTAGLSISHNTASPYGAAGTTGCAKITCAFTGTGSYNDAASSLSIVYNFSSPVNLKNNFGTIYMYIPPALAALNYATQTEFSTVNNPSFHALVGCQFSYPDWNSLCTDTPADADQTNAVRIYIYMPSAGADWSGDIYLDEVYW